MNAEIEKLIASVKEAGSMTARQKEIILEKAKQLGDDIDEVEFVLEDVPIRDASNSGVTGSEERRKCPNCGAIIIDTMLQCPECGYAFQKEIISSKDARKNIEELQDKLAQAAIPVDKHEHLYGGYLATKRQSVVINTFTLPQTKEGLMQLLEFSYSNYVSIDGSNDGLRPLKEAWLGKATQAIAAISRMQNITDVQSIIAKYEHLIQEERSRDKKAKGRFYLFLGLFLAIMFITMIICLVVTA